jgi:uncharacterized lipoprotein YddW (UPF0748 family)
MCEYLNKAGRGLGLILLLTVLVGGVANGGQSPSKVNSAVPFLNLAYADSAAAARGWQPFAGSAAPIPLNQGGHRALRLPCRFVGASPVDRASWDVPVRLDLSRASGIRFRFRSRNIGPARYFGFYFRSGQGWYSAVFAPRGTGDWEWIQIDKADMKLEGIPGGWSRIDTMRLSVWRGNGRNMAVDVADFQALKQRAQVAVLRGISSMKSLPVADRRSVSTYARNVLLALAAYQVPVALLEDCEISRGRLQEFKVVVLPYNPEMPSGVVSLLSEYVKAGGKIVGFYPLPLGLQSVLGFQSGRYLPATQIPGGFAQIRFRGDGLPGVPAQISQTSWNIREVKPVAGRSRVLADWRGAQGQQTGCAAVVASNQGMWMSHVLLKASSPDSRRMLLGMLGFYWPGVWQQAALKAIQGIGTGLDGADQTTEYQRLIAAVAGRPQAAGSLHQARQGHAQAAELYRRGQYVAAIEAADRAAALFRDAYYRIQTPRPGEFRGVWCHRPYGISGWSWDQTVARLAQSGFNAIFVNLLWGGTAAFPSRVVSSAPVVAEKGDQVADCLKACQRYGVQMHAWKVMFRLGEGVPSQQVERWRRDGRLEQKRDGTVGEGWLCPSDPRNQSLEIASIMELVRKYPVPGVQLDYIRYSGSEACFCPGCRKRFETFCGHRVAKWPADIANQPALTGKWNDFRRQNISALVHRIRLAVKAERPRVLLSAAVFSNPLTARRNVAQDWPEWARKGDLDFLCPMNYVDSGRELTALLQTQRQALNGVRIPLFPGIGMSTGPLEAPQVIEQIKVARHQNTGGFVLFDYNRLEAETILPQLGKGLTRNGDR